MIDIQGKGEEASDLRIDLERQNSRRMVICPASCRARIRDHHLDLGEAVMFSSPLKPCVQP